MAGSGNDRISGAEPGGLLPYCRRQGWLKNVFWITACIPGTMRQLPSGRNRRFLRTTIPLELNEGEIRHRNNSHSEMLVYGYLPLMMSAQCVRKNVYRCDHSEGKAELKDRYDKRFTAACFCDPWKMENTGDKTPCYNIIYNSIPYGLLREREQVRKLGTCSTAPFFYH